MCLPRSAGRDRRISCYPSPFRSIVWRVVGSVHWSSRATVSGRRRNWGDSSLGALVLELDIGFCGDLQPPATGQLPDIYTRVVHLPQLPGPIRILAIELVQKRYAGMGRRRGGECVTAAVVGGLERATAQLA